MSFFHHDPHYVSGVYVISVAARMLGMHPQTLRKYERLGFIMPSRTVGMLRLYSEEDIAPVSYTHLTLTTTPYV